MADLARTLNKKQKAELIEALRRWLSETRLPELTDKIFNLTIPEFHAFHSSGTLPPAIENYWLATCKYLHPEREELFTQILAIFDDWAPFRSEAEFWLSLNDGFNRGVESLLALLAERTAGDPSLLKLVDPLLLAEFVADDITATNSFSFRVRFPATTGTRFPTIGGGESQRLAVSWK